MLFTVAEKLRKSNGVFMYKGTWFDDRPFFAYILSDVEQAKKMFADQEKNVPISNFDHYGHVLYMDWKEAPDETAHRFLKEWTQKNGGSV